MPSRTLEDKVEELTKLTASLDTSGTLLRAEFKGSAAHHAQTDKALADFQTSVALLGQQIAELNAWRAQLRFLDDMRVEVAVHRRDLDELRQWREEGRKKQEE